jgi:hypothetical protein
MLEAAFTAGSTDPRPVAEDDPSDCEVRLICVLPVWLPVVAEMCGDEPGKPVEVVFEVVALPPS